MSPIQRTTNLEMAKIEPISTANGLLPQAHILRPCDSSCRDSSSGYRTSAKCCAWNRRHERYELYKASALSYSSFQIDNVTCFEGIFTV